MTSRTTQPQLCLDVEASMSMLEQLARGRKADANSTHHPVYDIFPCPTFRDAIINLSRRSPESVFFDEDALCIELTGYGALRTVGPVSEMTDPEPCGLIVWGEPYLVKSWEVTETFARKFSTLFRGCEKLLRSINY
ncbi:hypothetical protein LTR28_010978 [Elasticomyces elasticus]|nr:hypothetical protein LTR28_010978 [Elasticomyces elasticus]